MHPAIRCQNLSKSYHITGPATAYGYRTLREDLVRLAKAPLRWLNRKASAEEQFWALRGVDFTVQPGEVLGVIGRNGAGKSTLLKVLSRITPPTDGQVDLVGRVGSLLEVGTGFHPELTGRENIYLSGAILGMRRHEIRDKFDRIVEFAEIGPFLDTPVKRYSSGMYVRLAFSVAAHLEPEILIVDEVLAVGDMAFQRKCIGRVREVGRSGCTVLFVSHNMPAIETLCTRAILLDGGRVVNEGPVPELVRDYHRLMFNAYDRGGTSLVSAGQPNRALRSVQLLDADGNPAAYVPLGGTFHLRIEVRLPEPVPYPTIGVCFDDTLGQRLLTVHTHLAGAVVEQVDRHSYVDCRIDAFPLTPGDYWVKVSLSAQGEEIDSAEQALLITVADGEAFGEGRGFTRGVCIAPSRWSVVKPETVEEMNGGRNEFPSGAGMGERQ